MLQGDWSIERLARGGSKDRALATVPGAWEGLRLTSGDTLGAGEAMLYRLTLRDVPAGDYRLFVVPV